MSEARLCKPMTYAEAVAGFLEQKKDAGAAANTLKNYRNILIKLGQSCKFETVHDIAVDPVTQLIRSGALSERAQDANRQLIIALCDWLVRHGELTQNPIGVVRKFDGEKSSIFRPAVAAKLSADMKLIDFALWYCASHEDGISKGYYDSNLRPTVSSWKLYLGREPLVSDLNQANFNAWVSHLTTDAVIATETARNRIRGIRVLWNAAALEKLVEGREGLKLHRVRKESKTVVAWTPEEITKLMETALSRDDSKEDIAKLGIGTAKRPEWFASLIAAAYSTGLRLGDLWDIDRNEFSRNADGSAVISKPMSKTQRIHNVYLSPQVMLLVDRLLAQHRYPKVWAHTGKRFKNAFYRFIRMLVKEAGIRPGTMRFIRRACATQAEMITPGLGTQLLGHASRCVTIDSYIDSRQLEPSGKQLDDITPAKHMLVNANLALDQADDLPISVPRPRGNVRTLIDRLRQGPATRAQLNELLGQPADAPRHQIQGTIVYARRWLAKYLDASIVSECITKEVYVYRLKVQPGSKHEYWLTPRMPKTAETITREEMRERVKNHPKLLEAIQRLRDEKRRLFEEREQYLKQVSAKLEEIDNDAIEAEGMVYAAKRYRVELVANCPDEEIRTQLSQAKQRYHELMHGDNGVKDRRIELASAIDSARESLERAKATGDEMLIEEAEDALTMATRAHERTVKRIAETETLIDELEQRAINA